MIIPDGYRVLAGISPSKVMGTVLEWNDFTGEGIIFWHDFISRKIIKIPFVVEQVESPDFRTHNLFTLIRKRLGVEFVPLIKNELKINQVSEKLENHEMLPFQLKILIPGTEPALDLFHISSLQDDLKRFLLRREDLF